MRGDLTRQINVRLDVGTIDKINDLIRDGEFFSMADFLRYAANQLLKNYEGRSPPPLVNESPHGDCTSFRSRISESFLLFVR